MSLWKAVVVCFNDSIHPNFRTANSGDCWDLGRGWLNTEEVSIQVLLLDGVHDNSGIQQAKQIESNRSPTVRSFAKQNICLAWFVNAYSLWPCNAVSWEFIWRKQLSAWQRSTFGDIFCVLVSLCLVGFISVVTPEGRGESRGERFNVAGALLPGFPPPNFLGLVSGTGEMTSSSVWWFSLPGGRGRLCLVPFLSCSLVLGKLFCPLGRLALWRKSGLS